MRRREEPDGLEQRPHRPGAAPGRLSCTERQTGGGHTSNGRRRTRSTWRLCPTPRSWTVSVSGGTAGDGRQRCSAVCGRVRCSVCNARHARAGLALKQCTQAVFRLAALVSIRASPGITSILCCLARRPLGRSETRLFSSISRLFRSHRRALLSRSFGAVLTVAMMSALAVKRGSCRHAGVTPKAAAEGWVPGRVGRSG